MDLVLLLIGLVNLDKSGGCWLSSHSESLESTDLRKLAVDCYHLELMNVIN